MQTAFSLPPELRCLSCGQFDTAYFAANQSIGCYSCGIHPVILESSASPESWSAATPDGDISPATPVRPVTASRHSRPRLAPSRPHRVDFAAINRAALTRWPEVVARLLPAGRAFGHEWYVGSLRGEPGRSLKIRLCGDRAGAWCDFATGEKGGDPISLAAAVAGLSRVEAAQRLSRMLGLEGADHG
jgi:hypothetical protein